MDARKDPVAGSPVVPSRSGDDDTSLLALVDRLAALLERSDLMELEVEVGETSVLLRTPGAINPPPAAGIATGAAGSHPAGAAGTASGGSMTGPSAAGPAAPAPGAETASSAAAVRAPLTGIFYGAPAPGSAPYVRVGGEVAIGQVIGLIEAMKLFNEIKSDLAGRVVKVVADNGQLVKAKQPLIEVEPL